LEYIDWWPGRQNENPRLIAPGKLPQRCAFHVALPIKVADHAS